MKPSTRRSPIQLLVGEDGEEISDVDEENAAMYEVVSTVQWTSPEISLYRDIWEWV